MIRLFQPLEVPRSTSLSHPEFRTKDDGQVEIVKVDDSVLNIDPEDYDLEILRRSGTNIKEVSTILTRKSVVFPKNLEQDNNNNNDGDKQDEN